MVPSKRDDGGRAEVGRDAGGTALSCADDGRDGSLNSVGLGPGAADSAGAGAGVPDAERGGNA
jgi:hypothetical protein